MWTANNSLFLAALFVISTAASCAKNDSETASSSADTAELTRDAEQNAANALDSKSHFDEFDPTVYTNSIGMAFVEIPAGEYVVRWVDSIDGALERRFSVDAPLYVQTTEVTQGQWQKVMGTTPWTRRVCSNILTWLAGEDVVLDDDRPACCVGGDEAEEFCRRLSQMDAKSYRLPTEAEWEYACHAGASTTFFFGDDESRIGEFAWVKENASDIGESYAHPVGLKRPNPWGLYDIYGNVAEWCADVPDEDRIRRGGSFTQSGTEALHPIAKHPLPGLGADIGFRVVFED